MTVAEELAHVSQALCGAGDVDATLAVTCRLAVDHVPGCEAAGVLLMSRGSMRSMGATARVAEVVDSLQLQYSEGPCIDALRAADVVTVDDLQTDPRWPALGPAAVGATGTRSMLAHRLYVAERTMGALNLYSPIPGAFSRDPAIGQLGALFAAHAGVALAGAQAMEGLRTALESRETISVAMGILMARQNLSRGQAFDVLRRASQRENIKLRDIAARIAGGPEDVVPPR